MSRAHKKDSAEVKMEVELEGWEYDSESESESVVFKGRVKKEEIFNEE